jgi:hypothetical protein
LGNAGFTDFAGFAGFAAALLARRFAGFEAALCDGLVRALDIVQK